MSEFFVSGDCCHRHCYSDDAHRRRLHSRVADSRNIRRSRRRRFKCRRTNTGADALTIEQSVAAPIEQQMSGVDNMNYMYSINANSGDIRLIVDFDVATDPNIDHVLTQLARLPSTVAIARRREQTTA